jgi:hypothetical protein
VLCGGRAKTVQIVQYSLPAKTDPDPTYTPDPKPILNWANVKKIVRIRGSVQTDTDPSGFGSDQPNISVSVSAALPVSVSQMKHMLIPNAVLEFLNNI